MQNRAEIKQNDMTHQQNSFDHIVIGAGSAGCATAARLAQAGRNVALLEAGENDEQNDSALILSRWKELLGTEHDYDYTIEPQPRGNSLIRHTRGRLLGGTSSINTCIGWKTPAYDLQKWVERGANGWSPQDVAPTFEKLFNTVHLETSTLDNRFHHDLIQAAVQAGYPLINFAPGQTVQEGIGYLYFNKKGDDRQSASVAYLHPLEQWGDKLKILTGTRAYQLVIENGRATGVITNNGVLRATADIIVACGAFNSPALLMRSGIGPAEHLAEHGIDLVQDLAGVGQNLLDHPDSMAAWETTRPIPQVDINAMGMAVFGKTDPALPVPDMMCHIGTKVFDGYTTPAGYPTAEHGFSFSPNVARARSTGSVRLASADPNDRPIIDFNYYSDRYDEFILVEGIKLARKIATQPAIQPWIKRELFPGAHIQTDEALSAYARQVAGTVYHPVGTCKMGAISDETAVVDPELRVRGVDNLRVADASVFPTMIGVNPNLTIMMIGERCAEFLLS